MHLPGAGVGGHCIPKDSWLLAHGARGKTTVRLIPEARAVNDSMPVHMAELTTTAIKMAGIEMSKAKVLVLGYSYLEESDDTRNSPSSILVNRLKDFGLDVVIHDPWINEYHGDLYVKAANCDAAILMVGHREYRNLDLLSLRKSLRTPIIVDGRHVIDKAGAEDAGLIYYCVGIAKSPHPLA
jgi:UDP-N-acetyl-D-mannosaminuronic acid dehydrogenase